MRTYQQIAIATMAAAVCEKREHIDSMNIWRQLIEMIAGEGPSGSGIDRGTEIVLHECKPNRIVLSFAFHHMDQNGYYSGWTDHYGIVTPDLAHDFNLRITGTNRNDIKGYLHDVYNTWLNSNCQFNYGHAKEALGL